MLVCAAAAVVNPRKLHEASSAARSSALLAVRAARRAACHPGASAAGEKLAAGARCGCNQEACSAARSSAFSAASAASRAACQPGASAAVLPRRASAASLLASTACKRDAGAQTSEDGLIDVFPTLDWTLHMLENRFERS